MGEPAVADTRVSRAAGEEAGALPGGAPRLTRLCDYVRHYARTVPDREAIAFGTESLSYAAFDRRIDGCARALAGLGVGPGDRVAMLTTPRPEFAIVLMAALRIGAVWVGLNPRYRLAEMEYILDDCEPSVLFAIARDADGRSYAPELATIAAKRPGMPIIVIGAADSGRSFAEFAGTQGGPPDHAAAAPRDGAVIVYTSGTTGKPKGALLSHRNLIYSYESVSRSFAGKEQAREGLRLLCNLPPNHIGCISEMLGNAIIRGGTVEFAERFDPGGMLRHIAEKKITMIGGIPIMLQMLFDHPDFAPDRLASLRAIGWGGAPASRALVSRMMATGTHLFTNYGLTEGGAVITATPPDYDLDMLCETVGYPEAGTDLRLVDERGVDVAPGDSGEIWVRGPGVFLGYWNNPAATDAAFSEEGWLKTGDIAQARADGAWVLRGRRSEMFKSGGYNVYPREIELALEEHPDIAAAAVVSVKDPDYFEVGIAFVAARAPAADDALRSFLQSRLANYKIPKLIAQTAALPMLPIGKVDKPALKDEAERLWAARRRP